MKAMSNQEANQLLSRTEVIEAEKLNRQAEREQRQLEKKRKKRQTFLEKMVAPVLMLMTIIASLLFVTFFN